MPAKSNLDELRNARNKRRENIRTWSSYRKLIRQFFEERRFLEIVSPILVKNPGLEPHLDYFETESLPSSMLSNSETEKFFLPTSPEYHLKKVLGLGEERIFELAHCFRNGEKSPQHNFEFFMLEWYRSPGKMSEIHQDCIELFVFLSEHLAPEKKNFFQNTNSVSLKEIFWNRWKIDLKESVFNHDQFKDNCLKNMLISESDSHLDESFEDLFNRVFVQHIERDLGKMGPTFLWDFPAPLAALSKIDPIEKEFCHRFEVYIQGFEVANCFGEETDPNLLRKKCQEDLVHRKAMNRVCPPIDEDFIAAHQEINRESAGIALGLDRLFMILRDETSLKDSSSFV